MKLYNITYRNQNRPKLVKYYRPTANGQDYVVAGTTVFSHHETGYTKVDIYIDSINRGNDAYSVLNINGTDLSLNTYTGYPINSTETEINLRLLSGSNQGSVTAQVVLILVFYN